MQNCDIFKLFQVFSTCLLTFPYFACMYLLLQDGPRQLFQSYGFTAQNTSEEDKESAAAEAALSSCC
jgi:hypothetical protein